MSSMQNGKERSIHCAQVVVYAVDAAGDGWAPAHLGDSEWAELHVFREAAEADAADAEDRYRIVAWIPDTEQVVLNQAFEADTDWALTAEDFAELENAGAEKRGVYFPSPAVASATDVVVSSTIAKIRGEAAASPPRPESSGATGSPSPPPPAAPDVPHDVVSPAAPTPPPPKKRHGSRRRVSLILVENVANAIDEAVETGDLTGAIHRERVRLQSSDLAEVAGEAAKELAAEENDGEGKTPGPLTDVDGDGVAAILSPGGKSVRLSALTPTSASRDILQPQQVHHDVHVTYNAERARYEGLPEGWESLNDQFGVDSAKLPKVDCGYGERIPAILEMMRRELQSGNGREVVGIFRLAPDKDLCAEAKYKMCHGTYDLGSLADVNIIANLIKVWFREMPTNLFDVLEEQDILRLADTAVADIAAEVDKFPEPMKSLTCWLCDVMADIVMNEAANKMTAKNMAIVMSPNLFSVSADNPMFALTMSQKIADLTEKLLKSWLKVKHGYDC